MPHLSEKAFDHLRLTGLAASLPSSVPFTGPEAIERRRGAPFAARLGANENVFGPSPKVIAALQAAAAESWKYPDPESHDLRQAIATHHGIAPAHVMVGEGIDTLLGLLVRLMVAPGDGVVTSLGAYPTFAYHVTGFGGVLHTVPYRGDAEDPEGLIAAAKSLRPKLVYLANPENPMGTWHGAEVVTRMIEALPEGTLLVLDEAYIDFAPPGTAPQIAPDDPRVIRMRTFSKAYGLAGARVGYALGATDLIAAFDKVRNHFGMVRSSQIAALAALEDQDWLASVVTKTRAACGRLAEIGRANGLMPLPSATNFVTLDCRKDGRFAERILEGLTARGIFLRKPFVAPLDRCIRISAGTSADLDLLEALLPQVLAEVQNGD